MDLRGVRADRDPRPRVARLRGMPSRSAGTDSSPAFAGGILFGAATKRRLAEPVQFTETLGLSASFLVWSIFGALFVGDLLTRGLLRSSPSSTRY